MKRIDPVSVACFYLDNPEIRPTRQVFIVLDDVDDDYEVVGCCGATTQFLSDQDRDYTVADIDEDDALASMAIAESCDVTVLYVKGFTHGWDGYDRDEDYSDEYLFGYKDGVVAYYETTEALAS